MTGKIKVASVYFGRVSRSRRRSAQTDPQAYPSLEEIFSFGPAAHFTAEASRFPSMIVTFSRSCKVEISARGHRFHSLLPPAPSRKASALPCPQRRDHIGPTPSMTEPCAGCAVVAPRADPADRVVAGRTQRAATRVPAHASNVIGEIFG